MSAKPEEELIPADAPRWTVATIYKHRTKKEIEREVPPVVIRYELQYDRKAQEKDKGERGQQRLMDLAKFLNRKNLKPRRKIECAADAPNPEKYLHDLSN